MLRLRWGGNSKVTRIRHSKFDSELAGIVRDVAIEFDSYRTSDSLAFDK